MVRLLKFSNLVNFFNDFIITIRMTDNHNNKNNNINIIIIIDINIIIIIIIIINYGDNDDDVIFIQPPFCQIYI